MGISDATFGIFFFINLFESTSIFCFTGTSSSHNVNVWPCLLP